MWKLLLFLIAETCFIAWVSLETQAETFSARTGNPVKLPKKKR
jgi:hypothetical protein